MKTKHMTTLHLRKSIGRSPLPRRSFNEGGSLITYYCSLLTILDPRRDFLLIPLALAWFAISPVARSVSPAPDGGYPNFSTAEGTDALFSLTTGNDNTANGYDALYHNTTANYNTATGYYALFRNTTGYYNTATGGSALGSNTTGHNNTANGLQALNSNTIGNGNTAEGYHALFANTGSNNIGLGYNAGSSLTTGSGNVCIGAGVGGVAGESNTTRIGNVYSSAASGRAVYVNSVNKIGTLVSSRRFKNEIKLMDKPSEPILALKPVTFRYKKEIEPNGAIMFGLIAEEVEKVDPDLVTRNDKGEVETVRYDAVNAMLLNEFLKEHCKAEQLKKNFEATIAKQQKEIQALTAGLKEEAAQIQKVSDQLELTKPAPRAVLNDQ